VLYTIVRTLYRVNQFYGFSIRRLILTFNYYRHPDRILHFSVSYNRFCLTIFLSFLFAHILAFSNAFLNIVAHKPVAKQWLFKQKPLLGSARNSRTTGLCNPFYKQLFVKHVSAATDTKARIEERCTRILQCSVNCMGFGINAVEQTRGIGIRVHMIPNLFIP
jgi:hypothetical protein